MSSLCRHLFDHSLLANRNFQIPLALFGCSSALVSHLIMHNSCFAIKPAEGPFLFFCANGSHWICRHFWAAYFFIRRSVWIHLHVESSCYRFGLWSSGHHNMFFLPSHIGDKKYWVSSTFIMSLLFLLQLLSLHSSCGLWIFSDGTSGAGAALGGRDEAEPTPTFRRWLCIYRLNCRWVEGKKRNNTLLWTRRHVIPELLTANLHPTLLGTVCGFVFLCTFKLAHFGLTWILNSLGSTEDLFQTFCGAVMTSVGNWVRCLPAALRSVCRVRRPHRHLPEEWDSGVVKWQEQRGFGMHLGKEVKIEVWKTVQEQPLGRLRAHYVEWEKYSVYHRPKLRVFLHRSTYRLKLGGKSENWVLEADFYKIFLLVEKKYKATSGYFEGKGSEKYGLFFFFF